MKSEASVFELVTWQIWDTDLKEQVSFYSDTKLLTLIPVQNRIEEFIRNQIYRQVVE